MVALSFCLMWADLHWPSVRSVRAILVGVVTPIHWIADAPIFIFDGINHFLDSKQHLLDENKRLELEILQLQQASQTLLTLQKENERLLELLNASKKIQPKKFLVAELSGIDPDPFSHQIVLNKGLNDGLFVGQAVLDAQGLMGQVIETGPITSRVLLITDVRHAFSVENQRTGARAVAAGSGDINQLVIRYVPNTADIKVGDVLVSSGLDQRFPAGYPVAEITEIKHDAAQPFMWVVAKPKAKLDRSHYVILLDNQMESDQ